MQSPSTTLLNTPRLKPHTLKDCTKHYMLHVGVDNLFSQTQGVIVALNEVKVGLQDWPNDFCTISRVAPTLEMNTTQMLLAQTLMGPAPRSAHVNPILTGPSVEDLLNPWLLQLKGVTKQPQYDRNPQRWPVFSRELFYGHPTTRSVKTVCSILSLVVLREPFWTLRLRNWLVVLTRAIPQPIRSCFAP